MNTHPHQMDPHDQHNDLQQHQHHVSAGHEMHPEMQADLSSMSAFLSLVQQQDPQMQMHMDPSATEHMHVQDNGEMQDDESRMLKSHIFSGLVFTWSGKFSYPREEIRKKIEEHGGQCVDNVSKKVHYVLTTPDITKPVTSRINQAIKYQIPLLDEQYIHDCVQSGQRLDPSRYLVQVQLPQDQNMQQQQYSYIQDPSQMQFSGLDANAVAQYAAVAAANAMQDFTSGDMMQQQGADSLVHVRAALEGMINTHAQSPEQLADSHAHHHHLVNVNVNNIPIAENSPGLDMSENSKFTVKMYVKGSRQTVFSEQFPEILYTLTWKHKYDIRIVSNKKIFKGEQNKLLEAFTMMLVLAKNNEIPVYDEDKEAKRKRKRQKVAKRKQKKPTDTDTITISSLHKAAENEVIIRFGINSTFCSKRFNYSAFRLYINYAPQDLPDDYHFTIYSAEFKTFVKKNANITKYLHYPKQLNPTTTIITKDNTLRFKSKYAQVTRHDTGSSFGGGGSAAPRKRQPKRKRTEYGDEEGEGDEEQMMMDENGEWDQSQFMNMFYPFLMQQQQGGAAFGQNPQMGFPQMNYASFKIADKGIAWFGEPIGMNINGDVFYMAFSKDGALFKINDFVYLAPEEGGDGTTDGSNAPQMSADGTSGAASSSTMDPAMQMQMQMQMPQMSGMDPMQQFQQMQMQASALPQMDMQQQAPSSQPQQQLMDMQQQTVVPPQDLHLQQGLMGADKPVEVKSENSASNDLQQQLPSETPLPPPPQMMTGSSTDSSQQQSTTTVIDDNDDDIDINAIMSSAPESYWICKIINLVQTKNEGMKLIGQWFYRWCDVQGFGCNLDNYAKDKSKKQQILQKEKEVFVSFDLNYNSLTTVRGKCFVKFMDAETQRANRKWLVKPHHYFFQTGFNRLKGEFFELPESMLKIMRETTNEDDENVDTYTLSQQLMQNQAMAQMQQMQMQMPQMMDPSAMNPAAANMPQDWNALAASGMMGMGQMDMNAAAAMMPQTDDPQQQQQLMAQMQQYQQMQMQQMQQYQMPPDQ